MANSTNPSKRKVSHDAPISPPTLKRKFQSITTTNAVASFFTPTSQKPDVVEKLRWQERAASNNGAKTLLVGKYVPTTTEASEVLISKRNKVAAFDFDSTLIETSSGKKFASDAKDWKWWHASVPDTLKRLYQEGYLIIVLSNQGGLSLKSDPKAPKAKLATFKAKASAVFNQLDMPITIYAATEKDIFRKPRTGMWTELLEDYNIQKPEDLDLENSIFVGDAAGRHEFKKVPKDFSCSDRNFAENVGLKFHTPDEYFLGEEPRPFTRTFEPSAYLDDTGKAPLVYAKKNLCDIVLLCGSPGAGKSTFYWKQLEPLGYARINQDTLKTREKCFKVAEQHLKNGESVAIAVVEDCPLSVHRLTKIDNTNADAEVRSKWIALATKHSIPIRCVLFTAATEVCEHNDAVRALNNVMNPEKRTILPSIAFRGFNSRFQAPKPVDFQDITEVAFKVVTHPIGLWAKAEIDLSQVLINELAAEGFVCIRDSFLINADVAHFIVKFGMSSGMLKWKQARSID